MYQYTVTQWIFFFYFYCFCGWCFESAYVSLKTRKWTNRGFMRGPFLPLYGSGAIMMLVVSIPVRHNLPLTYLMGCIGATVLEYVTGVTMEALFKVRYWDYSKHKFQFQGHICLSSTLAWGGLTILMTEVVHKPVEQFVLAIPGQILTAATFLLTAVIFADFALSFKAALDLRDILVKLENAKEELARMQKRLDVVIALTTEEMEQKVAEYKEGIQQRKDAITGAITEKKDEFMQLIGEWAEESGGAVQKPDAQQIKEEIHRKLLGRRDELQHRRHELVDSRAKQFRQIFRANPTMVSDTFHEIFEELSRAVGDKDSEE